MLLRGEDYIAIQQRYDLNICNEFGYLLTNVMLIYVCETFLLGAVIVFLRCCNSFIGNKQFYVRVSKVLLTCK